MLMYVENLNGENGNFAAKTETIRTWRYHGYEIELKKYTHYYEKGGKHEDYAIFMNLYEDCGFIKWLERTYCLDTCFNISEAWKIIKELELEVTCSDFQYIESLNIFHQAVRNAKSSNKIELIEMDTETGDLWLFVPIDNHHVEAWRAWYLGEGCYAGSYEYVETISWYHMTPLERKWVLGWEY